MAGDTDTESDPPLPRVRDYYRLVFKKARDLGGGEWRKKAISEMLPQSLLIAAFGLFVSFQIVAHGRHWAIVFTLGAILLNAVRRLTWCLVPASQRFLPTAILRRHYHTGELSTKCTTMS
jgi:hypothetical protein